MARLTTKVRRIVPLLGASLAEGTPLACSACGYVLGIEVEGGLMVGAGVLLPGPVVTMICPCGARAVWRARA